MAYGSTGWTLAIGSVGAGAQVDVAWFACAVAATAGAVWLAASWRARAQLQREARERLRSELDLLQARFDTQARELDVLADGLDIALFVCDSNGVIQYANRQATDLFKIGEVAGRTLLAATLNADLEHLALDTGRTRETRSAELHFKLPEERVGLAKAWPDELGARVFVSIYEVSELRRLERIRQDFVANVSHEFRTPLTVIRALAEELLDAPEGFAAKGAGYLSQIVGEVERLSLISNDLLILSAAESNIVRRSEVNAARLVRTAVQALEPKARARDLELSYTGPPDAAIEGNETQLTQVFANLIDNALNYTPAGGVRVELEEVEGGVSVAVRDTGIGIASDHLPRIFERFFRVDRARSRSTGGTGLGLSIVKHIVEVHGGTVKVESALNAGSTFRVFLPRGEVAGTGGP